jgi:hypothetical protein
VGAPDPSAWPEALVCITAIIAVAAVLIAIFRD